MITKFSRLLGLVFIALLLVNCGGGGGGGDNGTTSKPEETANIIGTVTGSGGIPDVTVSAGGKSTTTDSAGNYKLDAVPVPSTKRVVLTFEKQGYATYQRSVMVEANKTFAVAASMTQYHFSEPVNPANPQNLSIADPKNPGGASLAMLDLPAGSVSTTSGSVTVNVAVGDPSSDEGRSIFPGDYMASPDSTSEPDTELESVAFAEITIKDGANDVETLNTPADLSIKLPDEFQTGGAKAGTYVPGDLTRGTIEWWSYNETNGSWIREDADPSTPDVIDDAAVIDVGGVLYAKAKVTHFSWWNADHPISEHSCLCVRVVDSEGNPVQGAMVIAEGVTYNGRSTPMMTDAEGIACVNVKRSTATQQERVKIYVEQGGAKFTYDVTDAAEGDVTLNEIITPTTQGSTLDGSGMCSNLNNDIALVYAGTITGTVTREGSGTPIEGFTMYTNFGASAVTNAAGGYEIAVPVGATVSVFAPGLVSQTVNIPGTDPVTVDFVVPNFAPVFDSVTRVPAGAVNAGATVDITAVVSDPDSSSPVSLSWVASTGSLSATTGSSVTWTAPGIATTAQITITATDGDGGVSEHQEVIVVTTTTPPSDLIVNVKNNPVSNLPVEGVTVALYNTDNRTISSVITTGADGVANFGSISRSVGTLSVIYQRPGYSGGMDSIIDSYVNVPMGEIVYYVADDDIFGTDNCGVGVDTTVNVNFTDVPAAATDINVQPGYNTFPNDSMTHPTVICSGQVQTDGAVSLLSQAVATDPVTFDQQLLSYGFLLDQVLASDATYTTPLTHSYITYGYTTTPSTPMYVWLNGMRKGVSYDLGDLSNLSTPLSAASTPIPSEFPADKYVIFAAEASGLTTTSQKFVLKLKNSLALTESIAVPDTQISSANYDVGSNSVSWSVSGASPIDYMYVYLSNDLDNIYWSVYLPENSTSWQVMDLPAGASFGTDTADLTNSFCSLTVQSEDVGNLTGSAEVWNQIVSGADFFEIVDQLNAVSLYADLSGPCALPVAINSVGTGASKETASSAKSNLLKPLRNLLRQ